MKKCELCSFRNPKDTVTAIIIRDNRLFLLMRNERPHLGMWDLPGGYVNENEKLTDAMRRELKEELSVSVGEMVYMKSIPGYASWKDQEYPVMSHFFLVPLNDEQISGILLNNENKVYSWMPISALKDKPVAFDTNVQMVNHLAEKDCFSISRVKELLHQLDPNAVFDENALYKAMQNGHVATKYDNGKLVGMGWIFPRQTILRKQAVVEDMIVDNDYRGKGYGKEILKELVDWARHKGMNTIELTTNPSREAAHKLYESFGFRMHVTDHMLYFLN